MESDVDKLLKGQLEMEGPRDNTVRVYLTSTFMDMELERRQLHVSVFHKVRSLCRDKGLELQVVDFGGSSVTSMKQCELDLYKPLCEPIVMVLLGERYGPPSIPMTISAKEFQLLKKTAQELAQNPSQFLQTLKQVLLPPLFEELLDSGGDIHAEYLENIALLHSLYRKDTNSVPPSYVLEDDLKQQKYVTNSSSEDKIQLFLYTIATAACQAGHLAEEAKEKYFQSAFDTFLSNILNPSRTGSAQNVVCVERKLNGLREQIQDNQTKNCEKYIDVVNIKERFCVDSNLQRRLQDLSKRVVSRASSTLSYTTDWSREGVTTTVPDNLQYLVNMCRDVEKVLIGLVDKFEEQFKESFHPDTRLLREVRHHVAMSHQLAKPFSGQEEVLSQIKQKIEASSLPLVIHGASGSGKTCLIGKLCELFPQWLGANCVKIVRFLGTSELTKDLRSTLNNICDHLTRFLNAEGDSKTTADVPDALGCMLSLGAKIQKPCLIALDAINELSPADASNVLCLLSQNLPDNVKFVISVTSDTESSDSNIWWEHITWKFHHADQCVEVPSFSTESSLYVLNQHLKKSQRCLTAYQRDSLVSSFSRCPTPLFIKLAIGEACLWTSHTKLGQSPVDQPFANLIERTLVRLETVHGKLLVSRTCALISSARRGLSSLELDDILPLDDEIVLEVFAGSPPLHQDIIRILSLRVKQLLCGLQSFLSATEERGCVLLTWSHKSIQKIIDEKYLRANDLTQNRAIHKLTADYWMGLHTGNERNSLLLTEDGKWISTPSVRGLHHQPSTFKNGACNIRKMAELPFHLVRSGDLERFDDILLNLDWILSKYHAMSLDSMISDFQLAAILEKNRGYAELVKALVCCKGTEARTHFVKQLEFQLLPSSEKYPGTVGKIVREIQSEKTFICCSGLKSSDSQSKGDPDSVCDVDPSLQNLAYNSEKGIIAGLTKDGRIGAMNLTHKTCSWSYFPLKADLSESHCILSRDASKLVVFGCGLAVVDMVQRKSILIRDPSINPSGALGRYVKAAISKDNKRIVAEEFAGESASILHVIDLNAGDQKYPCLPGLILFTENRVLFGTKKAGTSPTDRYCLMMEVMLSGQGPARQLSLGNQVRESDILCASPAEEQIAAISLEAYKQKGGKKKGRQLTVSLFATKQDKLLRTYQTDLEQNLDRELTDPRARFLTSCIMIFSSRSTWRLDLVTGELTEVLSFGLINPVVSQDGSYVAGVVKDMHASHLCIVATESADTIVKYFLPTGIGVDFLTSSKLDIFLFFVRGNTLPAVFVANDNLRRALNLAENGLNMPVFSTSAGDLSDQPGAYEIQQTQSNAPEIVVERISPPLLTGHPSPRPKTSRGQNSNGDLSSSSILNSSGEGIQMVEVHKDDSPHHQGKRLEEKAYFAKAPQSEKQLMQNNTATIRLRKMNFDNTEVTSDNSAAPVLVSFKDDIPIDDPMEEGNGSALGPVDGKSADPNARNSDTMKGSDSGSVVSSSSGSWSESESVTSSLSTIAKDDSANPVDESKTQEYPVAGAEQHHGKKRHDSSSGSDTHRSGSGSGSSKSGSESDSGSYTSEASKNENEDRLPNSVKRDEDMSISAISEGNQVKSSDGITDNGPDTTQSTTEVSDFRANYFISSASEEDYDGEVEDNTITEGDLYEDSKASGESNIVAGQVAKTAKSMDRELPMDTTEDSDESGDSEDERETRHSEVATPRRPVLLHRKNTSKNYFLSDDELDNPGTAEPALDRPESAAQENANVKLEQNNPDRDTEKDSIADSETSSSQSEEGKSKTCIIM